MGQPSRLDELRRRVRQDPASIAFAALAEEYRRQGLLGDAIDLCRAGLARHPTYLLGRVTLARALFDSGDTDAAIVEFEQVLRIAPDNLAALRGLAEAHAERGEIGAALERLRAAAAFAPQDAALRARMEELETALGPAGRRGEGVDPAAAQPGPGTAAEQGGDCAAAPPEAASEPESRPQEGDPFWPPPAPLSLVPDSGVHDASPDTADRELSGDVRHTSESSGQEDRSGAFESDGSDESERAGRQEVRASFSAAREAAPEPQAEPHAAGSEEHAPARPVPADAVPSRAAETELSDSEGESEALRSSGLPGAEDAGDSPPEAGHADVKLASSAGWFDDVDWRAEDGPCQDGDVFGDADRGARPFVVQWPRGAAAAARSASGWTEPVEPEVPPEAHEEGTSDHAGGDRLALAVTWVDPGQATDALLPAGGRGEDVEPAEVSQSGEGGKAFGETGGGGRLFVIESPGGAWTPEASEGESAAAEGEMPSLTAASEEQASSLPFAESTPAAAPDGAGWAPRGAAMTGEDCRLGSGAATIVVPNPNSTSAPGRLATSGEGVAAADDETAAQVTAPGLSAWSGESVEAAGDVEEAVATGADAWSVAGGPDDRPDAGVFEQTVDTDVRERETVPDGGASGRPFEITGGTPSAPGASARSSSGDLSGPAHPAASGSPFEPAQSGDLARAATSWDLGFPDAPVTPGPDPSGTVLASAVPASAGYPADGWTQSPACGRDDDQRVSPHPASDSDNRQQAAATWDRGFSEAPLPPDADASGALPASGVPASTGYPTDFTPPRASGSDNGQQAVASSHGDGVPSDRRTAALRTLERWLEALERARSARSCPP